nr:hypothetical protein Iba_chr10cCG3830 [Ipomoea batatas]
MGKLYGLAVDGKNSELLLGTQPDSAFQIPEYVANKINLTGIQDFTPLALVHSSII